MKAEIEEILEENIPDYALRKRKIKEQQKLQEENQKRQAYYASALDNYIKEDQVLLWVNTKKPYATVPEAFLNLLYKKKKDRMVYIWVGKKPEHIPESLQEEIRFVRKDTRAYWKAVATSKYLLGNTSLSGSFVQREGQVYHDSSFFQELFADKEFQPADIEPYFTQMLEAKPPVAKPGRVLILCNWADKRADRYLLDAIVHRLTEEKKYVTVMTQYISKNLARSEWDAWEKEEWNGFVEKRELRGRLLTTKEEFLFCELIRPYPELLMKYKVLAQKMEQIMKREECRIFQGEFFEKVLAVGALSNRLYQMAVFHSAGEKIFYDRGSFPKLRSENPQGFADLVHAFDVIRVPQEDLRQNDYGSQNKEKLQPWDLKVTGKAAEYMTVSDNVYLVTERWKNELGRECVCLVALPKEKSILVSANGAPNQAWMNEHAKAGDYACFYGKHAREWLQEYNAEGEVCDGYINEVLPLLPEADGFLKKFTKVYGMSEQPDELLLRCQRAGISVEGF